MPIAARSGGDRQSHVIQRKIRLAPCKAWDRHPAIAQHPCCRVNACPFEGEDESRCHDAKAVNADALSDDAETIREPAHLLDLGYTLAFQSCEGNVLMAVFQHPFEPTKALALVKNRDW